MDINTNLGEPRFLAASPARSLLQIQYSSAVEQEITRVLSAILAASPQLAATYHPRWLAIQLLEEDASLLAEVQVAAGGAAVVSALEDSLTRLKEFYGEDIDVILADFRYNFVHQLVSQTVTRPPASLTSLSDRADKIFTHRYVGIPIFMLIMWIVFKITTDVATPYLDWIDTIVSGPISRQMVALLGVLDIRSGWFESLVIDGIIAGVGGVLVFVPVLMALYLVLAILEDSGYMARAAFVMDYFMSKLGLHGKSFLPLIVGFGCTVPALYATRTLENERDRILTGLLVPFMSCGARLPVYVLFAAIFFPQYAGAVIFMIYLFGILMAVLLGLLLRQTLFKKGEAIPLLMEFPPYRLPTLKNIWHYVWERTFGFIHNAATVILAASVVIWLLMALPVRGNSSFADTDLQNSAFVTVAQTIAPVFTLQGFGSWESGGALVTGLVAKEVVISTLAQVYDVAEIEVESQPVPLWQDVVTVATSFAGATFDTLKSLPLIIGINLFDGDDPETNTNLKLAIRQGFERSSGGHGSLAALAFMVFVLLYTPCMASLAAERHELGTKWMWFSIVGQLAIAWLMSMLVFQVGLLLGLG
jgi:ferrous iron transport protein B